MAAGGQREVVRQALSVGPAPHRRLEEHLSVRMPGLLLLATRAWLRLPSRSRLRKGLLRHTVRIGVEAANRRDHEAAFGTYDPRVELHVPPDLVAIGFDAVTRGRGERIRFEERWRAEWGDFEYAPQELFDLGDRVLVIGRMSGSGPSSGAAVDTEWAVLFTVSAGRVVREQVFLDHAGALDAVGLGATSR